MYYNWNRILFIFVKGDDKIIIGIEGGLGSGKTLFMTSKLYQDMINQNFVYANYGLKFDYEPLNVLDVLESNKELQDVSIGIDEITVFVDCRRSASKMNLLLSYFILQTRKRNVSLYYTTQSFGMVDLRLFDHTHIKVLCEKIYYSDGSELEDYRRYTIFDCRDVRRIRPKSFIMNIKPVYDLYDTNEIILPPI